MINRREFVLLGAAGLTAWPLRSFADAQTDVREAMHASDLIYVTPIRSDGSESSCQSEIWFVADADSMYVVTSSKSWRARAAASGISRTRIWVGDHGNWKSSKGKYKQLPSVEAHAMVISDAETHLRVLDMYASKYASQWADWDQQFKDGLADKSRIMIHYVLA